VLADLVQPSASRAPRKEGYRRCNDKSSDKARHRDLRKPLSGVENIQRDTAGSDHKKSNPAQQTPSTYSFATGHKTAVRLMSVLAIDVLPVSRYSIGVCLYCILSNVPSACFVHRTVAVRGWPAWPSPHRPTICHGYLLSRWTGRLCASNLSMAGRPSRTPRKILGGATRGPGPGGQRGLSGASETLIRSTRYPVSVFGIRAMV